MATASSCWIGMDESKTLVTRETSHNHYGWTKAIADKLARDANGTKNDDGSILKAAVIRPCSAVFGAGDGINVEVTLQMKVAIIVDPKVTMDWVYVDNVVQGHLLCEEKLRNAPEGVAGEAFCISNNDPINYEDFYWALKEYEPDLWIIYVPYWAMMLGAHISENIQMFYSGKVDLGRFGLLTPSTMKTMLMQYSFKMDKAREKLGYVPAFNVNQGLHQTVHDFRLKKQNQKKKEA
jgi:nucleoside-diphosphate-sugar epimerase